MKTALLLPILALIPICSWADSHEKAFNDLDYETEGYTITAKKATSKMP